MITSPLRPRDQRQESGIAARGQLAHPRNALRRFTFVRDHNASRASFRPALTETPAAHNQAALGTARSIPGRALAFDVGFPLSGSSTGLTPPISTSVPGTPPARPSGLASIEPRARQLTRWRPKGTSRDQPFQGTRGAFARSPCRSVCSSVPTPDETTITASSVATLTGFPTATPGALQAAALTTRVATAARSKQQS